MKFISICDRTGIVECEIFAEAYRLYGLNTVLYPVTGEVKPFDNGADYTLDVLRVEKGRRHYERGTALVAPLTGDLTTECHQITELH